MTLAEMSMRSWIMQPGTMLTHWETVRYAAVSFLGLVSLLAAVMAMLYTSASDALGEHRCGLSYSSTDLSSRAAAQVWSVGAHGHARASTNAIL